MALPGTPQPTTVTGPIATDPCDARLFGGNEEGYVHPRITNPPIDTFERVVAELEGGEVAVALSREKAPPARSPHALDDAIAYHALQYGGTAGLFLDDASLLLRRLKNLPLRVRRHCADVAAVTHGLRQIADVGGMVSLNFDGGREAAESFLYRLSLLARAVSLGEASRPPLPPPGRRTSSSTPTCADERA